MIFDSHTHLNSDKFAGEVPKLLERAKKLDVTEFAVVGFDMESNQRSLALSAEYQNIWSIIGWHPTEVKTYSRDAEKTLEQQLEDPKAVAVGEIGLDYYWMEDPKEAQEKLFRRQIAIAREHQLPVAIHCRDAFADTYRILKEERIHELGGIMHSFNGDPEWMKHFLELGMHISFSGVVTFKNAPEVQAAAKEVPLERLLVETDDPYLTPVPYRGKRNEPGYTRYVVEKIAELRDVPWQKIAAQTFQNTAALFGIEERL